MTHKLIKSLIPLLLLIIITGAALAQSATGQICIRAFEDRNANSTRDTGEPFLTRSVGASLADADNVIIQSLLLDDSIQASAGTMCFQNLEPGDYTVNVISADYNATTAITFPTTVTETSIPETVEYGGQSVLAVAPAASDEDDSLLTNEALQRAALERIFLSAVGAGIVVGLMLFVGAILAFIFFRGRRQPPAQPYPPQNYAPPGTGAMRPIDPATGKMRLPAAPVVPVTGDTGQMPPVDANRNYMPSRQDRLDTGAMKRFTLEESGTQPPVMLDDAMMSDFVLDDDDTGQSVAITPVPDDVFKPPVNLLDDAMMSDFVLDDDDTGQSVAITPVSDDVFKPPATASETAWSDEDTGQSAAIRDDDIDN